MLEGVIQIILFNTESIPQQFIQIMYELLKIAIEVFPSARWQSWQRFGRDFGKT